MLFVHSKGQAIADTNFWESELAQNGLVYLTWNAGAGRLLLPDSQSEWLAEMRTARYVVVSSGPWQHAHGVPSLELLFEDESDEPFSIHIGENQTDRRLPENNQGGGFEITVWTKNCEQLRLPGKFRIVPSLPCLAPWSEQ